MTSEPMEAAAQPPKAPRWVVILLAVSLGLNLVVAGAMASRYFGRPPHKGHGLSSFIATLPAERRAGLSSLVEEGRQRLRQQRDRIEAENRSVISDLRAEPFESARFVATLDRLAAAHGEMRRGAAGLLASLADKMSPEERCAFADWRERREQRRDRRRQRRSGADED